MCDLGEGTVGGVLKHELNERDVRKLVITFTQLSYSQNEEESEGTWMYRVVIILKNKIRVSRDCLLWIGF